MKGKGKKMEKKNKKKMLWKIFISTLYLSAFTFGGGYVIVTLMKKKFVDDYHWIEENEMLDLVAIAQSSPGAIAVNGAIVVGYKLAGILGTIVAIIGTVIPPFLMQCINMGIVSGNTVVADGSFLPGNVSVNSSIEVIETVQQSSIHYLDELEKEMSEIPGYKEPITKEVTKRTLKSTTDPDCGYINQKRKRGLGYLTEMTVDTGHGIITGVNCYPANHRESDIILNHVKQQQEALPIDIKVLALDGGYDVGAVHRGLELLGIEGYTAIREYQNNALKKGFTYNQDKDCFVCENQKELNFQRLVFKRSTLNYYRLYSRARKLCKDCPRLSICEIDQGAIRINASGNYPAFHRNKLKYHTPEYVKVMRLRKIWAEGTFSVLKREHNLKRIHKRGIIRAEEECLFSAMALNLKRLVKAM